MNTDTSLPVTIGPWQVFADVGATRAAYARNGWDSCGCAYCRNFDAARAQVYPVGFVAHLQELGIDPTREIEVYEMGRMPSGRRLYGGWFYLIGQLSPSPPVAQHDVAPGFSIGLRERSAYGVAAFDGAPILQLDFTVEVPWVLAEPEPS